MGLLNLFWVRWQVSSNINHDNVRGLFIKSNYIKDEDNKYGVIWLTAIQLYGK